VVERQEDPVRRLAHHLLDQAQGRGQIELVSDYANALAITVVARILGVEITDTESFRRLSYDLAFPQTSHRTSEARQAGQERLTRYLSTVFAARRRDPRDDLVSALVNAEQDGDRLSDDELMSMVYLLLIAGYMTTAHLIGNATLLLLRHPDQLDLLRRRPELISVAVEELLRFESPLELTSVCYATGDIDVGGTVVEKGEQVRIAISAANRDEALVERPDVLDITRSPPAHLSFGQGVHYCIGAPLARLEARIALQALIERLPDLALADPSRIEWLANPILRGLQRLPLRF